MGFLSSEKDGDSLAEIEEPKSKPASDSLLRPSGLIHARSTSADASP